jgi:hypothetical protein
MSDESWAIVEIMGHRRRAGRVCEVDLYGTKMLRIDIPVDDGTLFVTEHYGGAALFCVTPTTEEVARAMAIRLGDVRPVNPATFQPALAHYREVEDEAEFDEVGEEDDEIIF